MTEMSDTSISIVAADGAPRSLDSVKRNTSSSNVVKCDCFDVNNASSTVSSLTVQHTLESENLEQQTWICCMKQRFGSIFNCERGSDVTFFVGHEPNVRTIYGHRVVLAVGSKVFEMMFNGHWKATVIEIELPDDDPATFFALLRYLYTDELVVTVDIVISVLSLAKYYHISALEKKCFTFFTDNLRPENAFFLLNQAAQFKEEELSNVCLEKIDECIADAIAADDFCNLDVDTLCLVLERDTLKIGEIELFEAVVKWSEAESRRKNQPQSTVLERPLSLIRFPLMTTEDFALKVVPLGLLPKEQTDFIFMHFRGAGTPALNFSTTPRTGLSHQPTCVSSPNDNDETPMICDGDPDSVPDSLSCEEVTILESPKSPSLRSGSFLCEELFDKESRKTGNKMVSLSILDENDALNEIVMIGPLQAKITEARVTKTFECRIREKNKTMKSLSGKLRGKKTNARKVFRKIKMFEHLAVKPGKIGGKKTRPSRQFCQNQKTESLEATMGKTGKTKERKKCWRNKNAKPVLAVTKKIGTSKTQEGCVKGKNIDASNQQPNKKFSRALCDKSFRQKSTLKPHMMSHLGEKNFSCPHCGKTFAQKENLKTHVQCHMKERVYVCEFCGKGFIQKGHLQMHLLTHTKEKVYACTFCGKGFVQKGNLQTHLLTHTKEKVYACTFCGKGFVQKGNLQSHQLTHTNDREFRCLVCAKSFFQKGHLTVHSQIHTGVKKFGCIHCGKAFRLKGNLKTHIARHVGEKQFQCPICDKMFAQAYFLDKHLVKKIHKNVVEQ